MIRYGFGTIAAAVALFIGYFRMARTMQINADGASNALQAWEMLHGNLLLRGWTVTDVSFYSTELVQYALIELVVGLQDDVFRIASAMTYTLLVLLVAFLAKGDATGLRGLVRMGLAVAIMFLPVPGNGYLVAFGGPNHVGTGVPLLVAWLILDKGAGKRWLPYAVAAVLTWGQIGDPLVLFIGVLPLALVSAYRYLRNREMWDVKLFLAALASVVIGQGALKAISAAGGFVAHAPPTKFSDPVQWFEHIRLLGEVLAVLYGGYLPDTNIPLGTLRLAGLALAAVALVAALIAVVKKPDGDRVNQILAIAILVNLGAFIASTLPTDLMSARQVSAVLPMGAVLAARVCTGWVRPRVAAVPVAAVLLVFATVFVTQALAPPRHEPKREIVAWLSTNGLHYGIGSYWNANDLTLLSRGEVQVIPLIGGDLIKAYRWESKAEWYDPARHDARFVILDLPRQRQFGSVEEAHKQFGTPKQRRDFGDFAVLVYDHNLLVGLPAECGGYLAPSMLECSR